MRPVLKHARTLALAFAACIAATLLTSHTAVAAQGAWVEGQNVSARLISGLNATGNRSTLPLGLELKLNPGWKTYWRTPGDAGLPPTLDWKGSENLDRADLFYPAPERFELFDLQTFGYGGHVVLPLTATLATPGAPAKFKSTAELLVCEKICIPETLELTLELPSGAPVVSDNAQVIDRFRSQVPLKGPAAGLEIHSIGIAKNNGTAHLKIEVISQTPLQSPDVLIESDPFLATGAPNVTLASDALSATLDLPIPADQLTAGPIAGRDVTATAIDGQRAIEQRLKISQLDSISIAGQMADVAVIVAIALLGGLILNLMPCVLPVLSIKLMAVLEHAETPPARIRRSFLATAAGITASLLALAVVLIALKASGQMVGWGIQFQQPVFIAVLTLIIALFAFNLAGLFEFALPSTLSNFADRAGHGHQGILRDFATGAFATLLATPCSAPFVGTAVGFALGSGTAITLLIFASLGLGLALPYLAVAAFPHLARQLPRPGPWMAKLRILLVIALAATALWLLSVLAGQIGYLSTALFSFVIAAIALVLVAPKPLRMLTAKSSPATAIAALCLVGVGITAIAERQHSSSGETQNAGAIAWKPFERNEIRKLVSQGRVVFVDVTADWCITCKTNKRLVIDTKPVIERLTDDVVPMRADWTSPDRKISDFLGSFGRYGIPLNAVFGPGRPSGILLPELLTQDAVLAALNDAASRRKTATSPGK